MIPSFHFGLLRPVLYAGAAGSESEAVGRIICSICLQLFVCTSRKGQRKWPMTTPQGTGSVDICVCTANTVKNHNLPKTSWPAVQQHPQTPWPWNRSAGLIACQLVQLGIQLFPLRLTRTNPALEASDCLVAKKERGIKKKKNPHAGSHRYKAPLGLGEIFIPGTLWSHEILSVIVSNSKEIWVAGRNKNNL